MDCEIERTWKYREKYSECIKGKRLIFKKSKILNITTSSISIFLKLMSFNDCK